METMMLTEAQLDRALYVFNDVSTDAPRKSVREALREAIEAACPVGGMTEEMVEAGAIAGWNTEASLFGPWSKTDEIDRIRARKMARTVIDAALAARSSDNRAAEDWQPIETAPRDGTWFLAHNLDKNWPGLTRFVRYKYADDRLPIGADGLAWDTCPTHWRPLPAPPSAVDTKSALAQDARPAVNFEMESSAWAEEVLEKHGVNIKFSHGRSLADTATKAEAKR